MVGIFGKLKKVGGRIKTGISREIAERRRTAPARRSAEIQALKQRIHIQKLKGQLYREKARTPSPLDQFISGDTKPAVKLPKGTKKRKKQRKKAYKNKKRTITIGI